MPIFAKILKMKKPIASRLLILFLIFSLTACQKNEQSNSSNHKSANEVSLVQNSIELKDNSGKMITVTYFAKGDQVAVRLKIDGKEHELVAKGINKNGNPIFTDNEYMWEMGADSHSGKLSDKTNKVTSFTAPE